MQTIVQQLDSFINNPDYNIDDYIKGSSGWLSYNQFLARQTAPSWATGPLLTIRPSR